MIDVLMGLPGKVKTLIDRLTAQRAANLDYLNAFVSNTAQASTALSNATWTNARAGYLDNLSGGTPLTAIVNSVQYGTVGIGANAASGTTTVTSVNTAKSVLIFLGISSDASSSADAFLARITLSNSTTITATRGAAVPGHVVTVSFCLVEFK